MARRKTPQTPTPVTTAQSLASLVKSCRDLVEKYADHGLGQFTISDVMKAPPLSERGTILEIIAAFGGPDQLRAAVGRLQAAIYAG